MIEADKASTSIYEVSRMSRVAMTHLFIIRMSSILAKIGRGHPDYTSGDVPTKFRAEFFSPSIMVKWMIDANNASKVISEEKRTAYAAMTHLLMANDLIIPSNLLCQ